MESSPVENSNPKHRTSLNDADLPEIGVDLSKAEVLKQLFGEVGDHIDDFTCAVQSSIILHGRMYITERFLCFYSNLFGLEKKIRIPFSHITVITKENTALVIPNAIAITTYRKEYLFRSFWDRDGCYKLLKDAIAKDKSTNTLSSESNDATNPSESQNPASMSPHAPVNATAAANRGRSNSSVNKQASQSNLDEEVDTEIGRKEFSDKSSKEDSGENHEAALEQEISKCKMKNSIIKSETLNISLDTFCKAYIEDSARFSWKKYHEDHGDKNIDINLWTHVSTSLGYTREFKFFKPVNLPGLKDTRAKKIQRYRKFGDAGLVICSSTLVEDVPAADTFTVEDVCAVRSIGQDKITVDIMFEVKFVKSTMLKYLIESNTNTEMTKWLDEFFKVMKQNTAMIISNPGILNDVDVAMPAEASSSTPPPAAAAAAEPVPEPKPKNNSPFAFLDEPFEKFGINSGRGFWGAVLLLLISFMYFSAQWRGVGHKLINAQRRLDEVSELVNKIAQTQIVLSENLSKQGSLIDSMLSTQPNSALSGTFKTDLTKISRLSEDIQNVQSKLDAVHKDLGTLMKSKNS